MRPTGELTNPVQATKAALRRLMRFVPARSEMRQGGAPQPPVGEHSRFLVQCET
jgi:hypothetical protein